MTDQLAVDFQELRVLSGDLEGTIIIILPLLKYLACRLVTSMYSIPTFQFEQVTSRTREEERKRERKQRRVIDWRRKYIYTYIYSYDCEAELVCLFSNHRSVSIIAL